MKRFIALVFVLVGCFLLALWSPWLYWKLDLSGLFGVQKPDSIAGLQVFSLSGELEVFLDNASMGNVKVENSPLIIDKVTPGEHLVALKRVSPTPDSYWEFGKIIKFEESTTAVISYNIGPEEEFSEGHIIYAVRKPDTGSQTQLTLTTNITGVNFQFDSVQPEIVSGNTITLPLNLGEQHKIRITKSGFEPLEFTILPESQEDRDKLKNYDINIEAKLMYQPVTVN